MVVIAVLYGLISCVAIFKANDDRERNIVSALGMIGTAFFLWLAM